MKTSIEETIRKVKHLYEQHGATDYIGEPVSQLEHMSQAAQLAIQFQADDELVLAAFFHDIGHLCESEAGSMGGFGNLSHERLGAKYLRQLGFPERIARLVENHVQAKRYLTAVVPNYLEALSDASKKTLEFQGGPMTEQEARAFEADPLYDASILLRKWDEAAKELEKPIIDWQEISARMMRVLSRVPAVDEPSIPS